MCPDDEALVRLANDPCSVENEVAAAHVYWCGRCPRRLEEILYPAGEPSIAQGERDVIAGFVAARCRRRPAVLDRLDAFIAARSTAFFSSRSFAYTATATSESIPLCLKSEIILLLLFFSDFQNIKFCV